MLFLFNAHVFDVADPAGIIREAGLPASVLTARAAPLGAVLKLVREVVFERPDFVTGHPDKAAALGALVAARSSANAMLAIKPVAARHPNEVVVRLAELSLPIIVRLHARQTDGRLAPSDVDAAVWANKAS